MEDVVDGVTVSDELRKMLVSEVRQARLGSTHICSDIDTGSSSCTETAVSLRHTAVPPVVTSVFPMPTGVRARGAFLRPGEG